MPVKPEPGVSVWKKTKAQRGFTLVTPITAPYTRLIDMEGNAVHEWRLKSRDANYGRMLPNGNLFSNEREMSLGPELWAGKGGAMREYDWDGNLVWEHVDEMQHHDARMLPNGHCIYIAWKKLSKNQAKKVKGGLPGTEMPDGSILGDVVREVDREGKVVWEWFVDDLKFKDHVIGPFAPRHEWAHANTVAPMNNGDILVSFRVTNTIVCIGRKSGKVKWFIRDDQWGGQHDCHQLENGNILMFANGNYAPARHPYSRVVEFKPKSGKLVWEYKDDTTLNFLSPHISGCQRLSNGNTLVCEGGYGRLFEVTPEGELVWQYVCDYEGAHPAAGKMNWIFRAYRYTASSPEIRRRLKL